MERTTAGGHHVSPEHLQPIPYTHPTFIEVYTWAKSHPSSKSIGDMRHEKTCVLARMMNALHSGYIHSLRDAELAVYNGRGYFQGSFLVEPWLGFILEPRLNDMTAGEVLQHLLEPANIWLAQKTQEIPTWINCDVTRDA